MINCVKGLECLVQTKPYICIYVHTCMHTASINPNTKINIDTHILISRNIVYTNPRGNMYILSYDLVQIDDKHRVSRLSITFSTIILSPTRRVGYMEEEGM